MLPPGVVRCHCRVASGRSPEAELVHWAVSSVALATDGSSSSSSRASSNQPTDTTEHSTEAQLAQRGPPRRSAASVAHWNCCFSYYAKLNEGKRLALFVMFAAREPPTPNWPASLAFSRSPLFASVRGTQGAPAVRLPLHNIAHSHKWAPASLFVVVAQQPKRPSPREPIRRQTSRRSRGLPACCRGC